MRSLYFIIAPYLLFAQPLYALELIGISSDSTSELHAIIKPSVVSEKHHLYKVGDRIKKDTRLTHIDKGCVKVDYLSKVTKLCIPLAKLLHEDKFSLIGENISINILLNRLSRTLNKTAVFNETVSKISFSKLDIYNLSNNDLLRYIKKKFYSSGLYIEEIGEFLVITRNSNLKRTLILPDNYSKLINESTGKPYTMNLRDANIKSMIQTISKFLKINIEFPDSINSRVSVIMYNRVDAKTLLNLLVVSTHIAGYSLNKIDDYQYIIDRI